MWDKIEEYMARTRAGEIEWNYLKSFGPVSQGLHCDDHEWAVATVDKEAVEIHIKTEYALNQYFTYTLNVYPTGHVASFKEQSGIFPMEGDERIKRLFLMAKEERDKRISALCEQRSGEHA